MPFLLLCLLTLSAPAHAAAPGHDESIYGARLAYEKVDGVGPCTAVEVEGNRLHAIGGGILYVLDISVPSRPKLLGQLGGLGNTRQIFVRNNIAYITARQDGLWLVDVADPAAPRLISHYDTVEMATGIWISGDVGFIATRCYGVEIVDVSDSRNVRHVSTLKTGEAQSCWARDGLLYIGDWAPKKLLVADVRDPRNPAIVGEGPLDGYGDGGCLRGKYCFAATGHHSRASDKKAADGHGHGLEIFDVSDPSRPIRVSGVKFPPLYVIFNDMWGARVAGDHCVVADTWNGVFVIDIRDVAKPAIVAHAQLPTKPGGDNADPVGGIALAGDTIYAAGIYTGLYVLSAPGLARPVEREPEHPPTLTTATPRPKSDDDFLAYRPDGQVHSVAIRGDVAWAACGKAGVRAVALGGTLREMGSWPCRGGVSYASLSGNRLVTSEGAAGMGIYDIGPGNTIAEIGRLTIPGQGVKQAVAPAPGEFALLHCGGAKIYIADIREPSKPKIAFTDQQVGLFYGDQLVDRILGDRFLVAYWQRSGPAWYDVAGAKPCLAGNTPDHSLYRWTDGACASGNRLLLVKGGRYRFLEPREMRNASDLPVHGPDNVRLAGRPSADGDLLALSRRPDRIVQILDISDPNQPRITREYSLFGHPGACAFWNGRAVIPAGYQGLLLERRGPGSE